jgi:hypothetical protein
MGRSKDVHVFEPLRTGKDLLKNITTRNAIAAKSTVFMPRIKTDEPYDFMFRAGDEHYGNAFKVTLNEAKDLLYLTMPLILYPPRSMLSSC